MSDWINPLEARPVVLRGARVQVAQSSADRTMEYLMAALMTTSRRLTQIEAELALLRAQGDAN